MSRTGKDMDRWLGDGGMPIIELVGGAFTGYGVDGEDLGWVAGTFSPTDLACNPHGVVQAGIHSLLLDAAMNFAINAALPGKARTRGTLEMKTETHAPGAQGRARTCSAARWCAWPSRWPTARPPMRDADGVLISRATGTFLLHRPTPEPAEPASTP